MPNQSTDKLRGGYYTPPEIADFLAAWATQDGAQRILEPSAGDGALVKAVAAAAPLARIDAVELMKDEADKISRLAIPGVTVKTGDLFSMWSPQSDGTYDAVVGNPPFIRYQLFPEAHREAGFALMRDEGLRPSRLTNAWVPFVVLATRALRAGGRLAMVIPAELMQVGYTAELRAYLARTFDEITIVTFKQLVFKGIQQETILLTGVRADRAGAASISFVQLADASDLSRGSITASTSVPMDIDHGREKWTQYYLNPRELGLIRDLESQPTFARVSDLAEVNVGIVTGRNEFFVLRPSEANKLGLSEFCRPLVGRSAQVPGLEIGHAEWQSLFASDSKCLLLQLGKTSRDELSKAARAYVEAGEVSGFQNGYKCRIRLPEWWNVPSDSVPEAFMLRQVYDGPRIIANTAGATSTDTIHRVRTHFGVNPMWLAAASINSLTFAFSEIRGRSYGGGVLELEPSEAEGLPIPRPGAALPLDELDFLVRNRRMREALDEVDRLTLESVGLTKSEIADLRNIWTGLSNRRLKRTAVPSKDESRVQ